MERVAALWEDVRSSLWFRPGVLTLAAIAAAFAALALDRWVAAAEGVSLPIGIGGDPESARVVLGAIAGGMITLAGVSFSIVVIALTLASNQFSPRVLRNFTSDRVNQTTLGVFVATFVYAVLVLRAVQEGPDGEAYVPSASVLLAIVAAVGSLAFFIYFIHHIATGIQISQIVRNVAEETHDAIEALLDSEVAITGPTRARAAPLPVPDGWRASAEGEGYVERVDESAVVGAAKAAGVRLDLLVGPGDFVARGSPLVVAERAPEDPEALAGAVRGAVFLARQRTVHDDPASGFGELVDIAVKALSPGINDPNTAANCVDYLGSLLRHMADRDWPAGVWSDEDGVVRVRLPTAGFGDYVAYAFTEIRRYARSDLAVTLRVLEALGGIADATARPDRRATVWEEATRVVASAERGIEDRADRRAVDGRFERLAEALGRDPAPHRLEDPGEPGQTANGDDRPPDLG